MKIPFTKRRLNFYLLSGIGWLAIGVFSIVYSSKYYLLYGYIPLGLLNLGTYFFLNYKQYLSIENDVLTKNTLIPKKIFLSEIIRIKKFAGDYILKTEHDEIRIDTKLIEKDSLVRLNSVLDNLKLKTK